MQVTEQGVPTSEHADSSGRWHLLMLLLFAIALGCYQQGEMSILLLMIREQLKLSVVDIGSVLFSFYLASTAGFLLMAVFIWRERGWAGYAILGTLGVLGALLTGASSGVGGLIVARGITGLTYGGLLVGAYRRRMAPTRVSWAGDRTPIRGDTVDEAACTAYHCERDPQRWLALAFAGCGGVVVSLGTFVDLAASPVWGHFAP
jgi:hypothetical protein